MILRPWLERGVLDQLKQGKMLSRLPISGGSTCSVCVAGSYLSSQGEHRLTRLEILYPNVDSTLPAINSIQIKTVASVVKYNLSFFYMLFFKSMVGSIFVVIVICAAPGATSSVSCTLCIAGTYSRGKSGTENLK